MNEPFLTAHLRGFAGTLRLDARFALRARWTVLFGPSGAGKSTVLHGLCGLSPLVEHKVVCDGVDLSRSPVEKRRFALVTQRPSLFPHLSARDNVRFSLRARKDMPHGAYTSEVDRLLRLFHAGDLSEKKPHQLSGGEQQRVVLARAVASRPRLLLLDEALSGLGHGARDEIAMALRGWAVECGAAILSVTHDVAETMECADEVIRMDDGRAVEHGSLAAMLGQEKAALLRSLLVERSCA